MDDQTIYLKHTQLNSDQSIEDHVTESAIDFMYENLADVGWFLAIFPIVVSYLFWNKVSQAILIPWLMLTLLMYGVRFLLIYRYQYREPGVKEAKKWGNYFAYSSLVSGFLWGITGYLFYVPNTEIEHVVLYVMIGSMAAGAVMVSSYWLMSYLAYALLSLGLLALNLFIQGSYIEKVLALLMILFLLMLFRVSVKTRDVGYRGIRLWFENSNLVDKLQEQKERAEAANRSKTQFLASANHDIRQPVHALSMLTFALKKELTNESGKKLYNEFERTVGSLNNLLSSLLDLSQLDANAIRVHITPVSVREVSQQILLEFLPQAQKKNLGFKVVGLPRVKLLTDETLLMRLIRNLVSNAIRYTKTGRVLLAFRPRQGKISVEVWDTGIGLDPEHRADIFKEFYQLENKQSNTEQGLGLGLSICQRIAKLLETRVECRSIKGKGSVFRFLLPVSLTVEEEQKSNASNLSLLTGKKILIVDDEMISLVAMSKMFDALGVDMELAKDGKKALQIIQDENVSIDLIISDFRLEEGVKGTDIIKQIRAIPRYAKIPALIITGDTSAEVLKLLEGSQLPVLHKPVDANQMIATLNKIWTKTQRTLIE